MDATIRRLTDLSELTALVHGFACRDQGRWEELTTLFWPGAPLSISWFKGVVEDFVRRSRLQAEAGRMQVKHLIGTPRLVIEGHRAIGDTDVTIMLRGAVGAAQTLVDVVSYARFVDTFEKRDGAWRIASRTAVYEKDRADAVESGTPIAWSTPAEIAAGFCPNYRALSLLMAEGGVAVGNDAIVQGSAESLDLMAACQSWISGDPE
jgi:hypothetical protein